MEKKVIKIMSKSKNKKRKILKKKRKIPKIKKLIKK